MIFLSLKWLADSKASFSHLCELHASMKDGAIFYMFLHQFIYITAFWGGGEWMTNKADLDAIFFSPDE